MGATRVPLSRSREGRRHTAGERGERRVRPRDPAELVSRCGIGRRVSRLARPDCDGCYGLALMALPSGRPARKQISERPRCGEGESQYDGIACTPSTRVACGARGGYKGTSLGQSEHGRERRVSAENGGLGQVGRQPCRIILIGRWNLGATARFLGFGGVSLACPLAVRGEGVGVRPFRSFPIPAPSLGSIDCPFARQP